jgi:hypothetical protein
MAAARAQHLPRIRLRAPGAAVLPPLQNSSGDYRLCERKL